MYFTDGFEGSTRYQLTRRICVLAGIMIVISLIAIIIGIWSVSLAPKPYHFPFSAGAAMVSGIFALLLSCCPIYMFYEESKTSANDTSGCFDCCTICMVVWFSLTILAVCFGFGLAGIYGVVACTNDALKAKVCAESANAKYAISIVSIIITIILFVLVLAIFFTCCCNSETFGMPLLASNDSYSYGNSYNRPGTSGYIRREPARQNDLSEARRQPPRPRSPIEIIRHNSDIVDRTIREPSAPSVVSTSQNWPDIGADIDIGPTSMEPYSPGRSTNSYSDPPPSYDEVMKKEQSTETPV